LLQQAQDYTQKIKNLLKRLKLYFYWQKITINQQKINKNNLLYKETIQALADNLNTIKVFYYLDKIIYLLNKELDEQKKANLMQELSIIYYFILDLLGFKFELVNYEWQICYLLAKWQKLRQNKQFLEADQIRKQLQEKDII
jgi:cysteinyl-tRNA synthetase